MSTEQLVALNELCVTDFVMANNADLRESSKVWVENTDEAKQAFANAGISEDRFLANADDYGVNVYPFFAELGILYLPDFGFAIAPAQKG